MFQSPYGDLESGDSIISNLSPGAYTPFQSPYGDLESGDL